ncbi:nuclear transport factor 2 family protein [Flavobacteriaceae bacterium D16]|nr:nuclear transport factor 2 family protein [Flavobacteriaceae bacterium D16]
MKKVFLLACLMGMGISFGQTKKNGTIFIEHPAIETVNAMTDAFVAGDSEKVGSYLHEDFKSYNGSTPNKDAEGASKDQFINQVNFWKENISYLSIEPSAGAYPDAMEYKDGQVWVQTWNHLKGVHNSTGVKIDVPIHRMYRLKDGKIDMMVSYHNERIYWEIGQSFEDRENGTIYNHHDNINSVRMAMHAFEHGDFETAYSFFDEEARFSNLEMPRGETMSMDEVKNQDKEMIEKFEINSIDVVGYPDYLEYDLRDGKTVQSWWDIRLTRKSDKKKIVMPAMFIHDFNDEGKITSSSAYFSSKWLD